MLNFYFAGQATDIAWIPVLTVLASMITAGAAVGVIIFQAASEKKKRELEIFRTASEMLSSDMKTAKLMGVHLAVQLALSNKALILPIADSLCGLISKEAIGPANEFHIDEYDPRKQPPTTHVAKTALSALGRLRPNKRAHWPLGVGREKGRLSVGYFALKHSNIRGADFFRCDLNSVALKRAKFTDCAFTNTTFRHARLFDEELADRKSLVFSRCVTIRLRFEKLVDASGSPVTDIQIRNLIHLPSASVSINEKDYRSGDDGVLWLENGE